MISTFFLTIFNSFIGLLLGILPTGVLPISITSGITYVWSIANQFSYIFPISTLLLALVFVIGFDLAMLLWHIIQWVIRKIPGMQ